MVLAVLGDGFGQSRSGRLITNSVCVYTKVSECVTYLHIGVPARTRFYASRIHEFKNDLPMKSIDFASKATQNNYEITMMTLKGETFAGFKIQRLTVF